MDKINSLLASLVFKFTAPTPLIYKFFRTVWVCITTASATIIAAAEKGLSVPDHLLLGAKVVGGLSVVGILHAQSKVDPNAITPPTNTPANDTANSATSTSTSTSGQ